MNQRRIWARTAIGSVGALALVGTSGCSLLYDFNTSQCNETQDCRNQGPQFNYAVCINHVCVQTAGQSSGGSAGTGAGGVTAAGGVDNVGGGSGGAGGASNTGGAAAGGVSSAPECTSNAECITNHVGQAYICRAGSCVQLTTPSCPVLIPAATAMKLLKEQSPIIVGGFANLTNAAEPHSTQSVVNWDLAFDEFNSHLYPGLASYPPGGAFRPFVGVVCQGYDNADGGPKDIAGSMALLVDKVGVTSILSSMPASDLLTAWNSTASTQNVFFMNTGSADLKLVNTSNGGMLWHMLGDPHMMAATIVALFHQMEPYVYKQRQANYQATGQENPDATPLRVAIVYSSYSSMLDLHDVLVSTSTDHPESHLTFNGKSWLENVTEGNTTEVRVPSGASSSDSEILSATTAIQDHAPHIILGLGTAELPYVIGPVEANWGQGSTQNQMRPYYVLSHMMYNNTTTFPPMVPNYQFKSPPLPMRMAGVNYAQAQDKRSQDNYFAYLNRLTIANSTTELKLPGTENYYDAAYYVLYSNAAAASRRSGTPTSLDILAGLQSRVINTTNGTTVDIDPGQIGPVVGKFFSTEPYYMALWGTMGYSNFDPLLGTTRITQTSVWCYQKTSGTWGYQADGLFYDSKTQAFSPNKNGVPACLQNYCPQDADAGVGTCPENY